MRALLATTDSSLIEAALHTLERRQHQVEIANDLETALWLAASSANQIIVLDDALPELPLAENCRQLRACAVDAALLVVVTRESHSAMSAALDAGADDVHVRSYGASAFEHRLLAAEKLASARCAATHDITGGKERELELRRARDEAHQTNQFVSDVLENIPSLVFVRDTRDASYVRVNRAFEEFMGLPRAQLLGKTSLALFPAEQAAYAAQTDQEALAGKVVEIPLEPIDTPRGRRLLHIRKAAIADASGTPRYVLAIAEDITKRAAESQVREQLAAIVHDSDDAIIGRSIEGLVTSWNPAAERLFGFSEQEMVGHDMTPVFPPGRREEESELTRRILRGEHIANFETTRLRKDGRELELSVTLSALRDTRGAVIGTSKIARDISELKQMQRGLIRAKERLESVNHELETFSYSVAHDLRAPLRSIDGYSLALLEDYGDKLDGQARKYLEFVRESAQLMAKLIDDILALSRVGRSEIAWQTVDISGLAAGVCERLRRAEPERHVEIAIQSGLSATCDPRLLEVVLENLLGNAWKFTGKCSEARIELGSVRTPDGTPAYFVRDNGVGFDMAYVGKLFGLFQRLHSTREFPGTGVGLAIVQRIIQRHGGRVWAEARIDDGATFYFTLAEERSRDEGE